MNNAHSSFVGTDGTWVEVLKPPQQNSLARPALFLDRDGTIVEEVLYLHRPEEMKLIPGAADTIIAANTKIFLSSSSPIKRESVEDTMDGTTL